MNIKPIILSFITAISGFSLFASQAPKLKREFPLQERWLAARERILNTYKKNNKMNIMTSPSYQELNDAIQEYLRNYRITEEAEHNDYGNHKTLRFPFTAYEYILHFNNDYFEPWSSITRKFEPLMYQDKKIKDLLGDYAFFNEDEAEKNGWKFSTTNNFTRGEIVIVNIEDIPDYKEAWRFPNGAIVYGIALTTTVRDNKGKLINPFIVQVNNLRFIRGGTGVFGKFVGNQNEPEQQPEQATPKSESSSSSSYSAPQKDEFATPIAFLAKYGKDELLLFTPTEKLDLSQQQEVKKIAAEILQIDLPTDYNTVNKAYRKIGVKWHPDRWPNLLDAAERAFKIVSQARDILNVYKISAGQK